MIRYYQGERLAEPHPKYSVIATLRRREEERRQVEVRSIEALRKYGSLAPQPPKPRFAFVPYPLPSGPTAGTVCGVVIDKGQ